MWVFWVENKLCSGRERVYLEKTGKVGAPEDRLIDW